MRLRSTIGLLLLLAVPTNVVAAEARFSDSWIVVRLKEPLVSRASGDGLDLVTGKPGLDAAIAQLSVQRIDHALQRSMQSARTAQAVRGSGLDRVYRFHVPPGTDIRDAAARLAGQPGVEYAEPDFIFRTHGTTIPNDLLFTDQWAYRQASDVDVDGPEAWSITTGAALKLGILDTGVDMDHPDLVGKLDPGWDFVNDDPVPDDDFNHGALVASIAAADTDNVAGIAAACWNCRIVPLKVINQDGDGLYTWFADAVVWGVENGVELFNFSAGGSEHAQITLDAVRHARAAGAIFVATTGNSGPSVGFPARYEETIAVGASTGTDQIWSESNTGPQIDVVAPGTDIVGADPAGGYQTEDGTSMAAPLVTGLAALLATVLPNVGNDEARHLIRFGAADEVGSPGVDTPGWDSTHGWGRVDMHDSLLGAQAVATLRVEGKTSTRLYYEAPNPVATSYDFVRGDLADLVTGPEGIEIGDVLCLENDSPDPDTTGDEDVASPSPGEVFFYLGRFNSGVWPGSFGGSSKRRDRVVLAETMSADQILDGQSVQGRLGGAIAGAGDVDGDGFDDMIAGAWGAATAAAGNGSAFVFMGSALGLGSTPDWEVHADQAASYFGRSVSSAGDVNGDGYDDVIVGQPRYDEPGADSNNEGRAYVYLGSAFGLSTTPHRIYEQGLKNGMFGFNVAGAGDVNGDGYDDVLVASTRWQNPEEKEGRVLLYTGSSSGLSTLPAWTFESNQEDARLGAAIAGAGDVNDDGFDDVLVASALYDAAEVDQGRVWVFLGSNLGLSALPATILQYNQAGARFGATVAGAGDVNGDDKDDVVIAALRYENGEIAEGAAFVYLGTSTGVSTTPVWSFESDQYHAEIADASVVGDVDHDGHRDLMVGSSAYYWTRPSEGRVWFFPGTGSGPQTSPTWAEIGRRTFGSFGVRVVGIGDVNSDGYDDVAVGADRFETTEFEAGRIHVYYGSAAGLADPDPVFACDEQTP